MDKCPAKQPGPAVRRLQLRRHKHLLYSPSLSLNSETTSSSFLVGFSPPAAATAAALAAGAPEAGSSRFARFAAVPLGACSCCRSAALRCVASEAASRGLSPVPSWLPLAVSAVPEATLCCMACMAVARPLPPGAATASGMSPCVPAPPAKKLPGRLHRTGGKIEGHCCVHNKSIWPCPATSCRRSASVRSPPLPGPLPLRQVLV